MQFPASNDKKYHYLWGKDTLQIHKNESQRICHKIYDQFQVQFI